MNSLFEIGINSLAANQYAMTLTSQNIQNAKVPFYSRRDVVFSESFCSLYSNGSINVETRRIYDNTVNRNVEISNSALSGSATYLQGVKNFETLFDNNASSISTYINESLKTLNVANGNASSPIGRDNYLFQLNNLATRFNALNTDINNQQKNINSSLTSDVNAVNDITSRLAYINSQVPLVNNPEDMANLLDSRDKLISDLSKLINFDMETDDKGVVQIQMKNGSTLVMNDMSYNLATQPAADDPSHLDIVLINNNSQSKVIGLISGGEIGGLIAYQNTTLDSTKKSLGRLALVLGQTMNNQNKLGIDLNGNLGGNIFNDINQSSSVNQRVISNANNQGSASLSVTINNAEQLSTSDYELVFDTPTQYQLVRKSDNQIMSAGNVSSFPASINADGFSLNIASGSFVAGDKFLVSPTKNAAGDFQVGMSNGAKLALGLPVVTSASLQNTGSGSINVGAVTDISNSSFSTPGTLSPPIKVEFMSATSFRIINADDNTLIEDNISYDAINGTAIFPTPGGFDPGYRANLSGTIAAGDQFAIDYNINGAGDNRNGMILADLYKQGVLDNNTLNFSQAYNLLSNDISAKANAAQLSFESNSIVNAQAQNRRRLVSEVSLEEETINLARFQQAYEASAQIIDAGQKVFSIVIGLARR